MKTSSPLADLLKSDHQSSSYSSLLSSPRKPSLSELLFDSISQTSEPRVIEDKKSDRTEKKLDPKYRLTAENSQKLFDKVDELEMKIAKISAKVASSESVRNSDPEIGNSRESFWKGAAFGILAAFAVAVLLWIKFS